MKKKYLIASFIFLLFSGMSTINAQHDIKHTEEITYKSKVGPDGRVRCFTMEADSVRRAQNPGLPTLQQEENWLQEQIRNYKAQEAEKVAKGMPKATVLTLPMVFHIITDGTGATNISAQWVQYQIDQLNIDYRNLAGSTNAAAGDCQLQFCLALRDPNNNTLAEPGIHRVTTYGAGTQTQTTMDNTVKPATIWDPSQYINIWVVNLGNSLLGYAQFPSNSTLTGLSTSGGSANTDGVVILYTSLGSVAHPNPAGGVYGKGRTLSHELGHWLGLRHIWGDGTNCSATDYCADTPPASAANYGCPTGTNSCTTDSYNDMIQNYMDYTDDGCMNLFTNDQVTRVRTVMNVATNRASLASSTKCNSLVPNDASISAIIAPTGTICGTNFTPQVTLKNLGNTTMTSCVISYNLDGGTNQTYNWTGSLAPNATTNITLNAMTAAAGTHVFNVSSSLPNGNTDGNSNNDSNSSNITLSVVTGVTLPFTEGFTATTFPPTNWTINNGGQTVTWARATVGNAPTTGNSAMMDNYTSSTDLTGDVDDLKTPALNLSSYTSATLTFDVAHARYSSQYIDSLKVLVSTNCGSTWTTVYAKGGSTLATQADQTTAYNSPTTWRNETVNLTPYVGNNAVYVMFRNVSGYGQKIYLDNVNITGNVVTTAPTASFSAASTTACVGQTVQYTSTSTGNPTTYSWNFPGGTPSTSTAQNPTVTYSTAGTYNASLTVTNSIGTNTSNQTNYVTVNAVPTVSNTVPSNRCGTGTVTLTATGSGSSTLNWYSAATGGTSLGSGSSFTTPSISTTTTYYVSATANGCSSARSAVIATINPIPTVTNPGNKTVCAGSSLAAINFSGSSSSSTYSWTNSNTNIGLAANGTGNIASFTPSSAGTATIVVTPTLNSCVGSPVTFTISVGNLPTVTLGSLSSVCDNDPSFSLSGGNPTGGTYSGTGVSNNMFDPAVAGAGTFLITYTVTQNGCTNQATSNITVDPCAGIDETLSKLIVIYPNPTSGLLTVKDVPFDKISKMELVDAAGKIVAKWNIMASQTNFDLSNYASGSYNLVFSGKSTHLVKKIEIKK